jgi:VanZ family protein
MRHHLPRYLLLASGISGMLFFASADFTRPNGTPQFGTNQLAGFVISTIIVLAGMHTSQSPRAKTWFGALCLVYLAGILFMGLKPSGHPLHFPKQLLITSRPPVYDFIINILGFIPFAYLCMAYLFAGKRACRIAMTAAIALSAGMGTSLFMELVQYYIPGRTSSLMDLIANTAGTSIGIAYFLLEKRVANHR